jgi:hypothetical protein
VPDDFTFAQSTPAAVWTITHPLRRMPDVTVVDSSGREVEGEVQYPDDHTVIVRFGAAFSGTAYLT